MPSVSDSRWQSLQVQGGRFLRQAREILRQEGVKGLVSKLRSSAAAALEPKEPILPVWPNDVILADISQPVTAPPLPVRPGEPKLVNWVVTPPSPGSGGHTTLFRLVNYLEKHGYSNRIYFYDAYRGDRHYYEGIVRRYYGFNGPVADVRDGIEPAHAVIATAWPTAYPVFISSSPGKRFYLVQDFEPFFHPVGTLSLLAENTYRMGFHGITAGSWLAQKLTNEYDMAADSFEFGCDVSRYFRDEKSKRTGIVFYAKLEAARRGSELGVMALAAFARKRPDIEIHVYGDKLGRMPFRYFDHGRVCPEQLNRIYNRCFAGLSLSLTNVSLVPHEMLAAGCIPVVNDAEQNRIVLNNPYVRYAPPHPVALATDLEKIVTMNDFQALSRTAANSVRSSSWEDAGASVAAILERNISSDVQCAPKGHEDIVPTSH